LDWDWAKAFAAFAIVMAPAKLAANHRCFDHLPVAQFGHQRAHAGLREVDAFYDATGFRDDVAKF